MALYFVWLICYLSGLSGGLFVSVTAATAAGVVAGFTVLGTGGLRGRAGGVLGGG